jgi:ribonuclease HI
MAKKKYYVVWKGRQAGIYDSWDKCQEQVSGYADAKYKSFESQTDAQKAFKQGYSQHIGKEVTVQKKTEIKIPYKECLCVDAACNMQTGDMEYRGVHYPSGKVIFHQKDFKDSTNNIGEFLAIVHGLAFLLKNNVQMPIYSDSKTALAWLRNKHCKTEQAQTKQNENVFELIDRAEKWLQENDYKHIPVLKWETDTWGEIPADFGRK